MSKFNVKTAAPVGLSAIKTEAVPTARTAEGAAGYVRKAESELFLLAVTNMVGEDTFYEKGDRRDSRFAELVRALAVTREGFDFLGKLAPWLRSEANMRSASVVLAAEAVHARLEAGLGGNRHIINAVLQRPDEPGEFLAYWTGNYGRELPMPVKRGVGDAAVRLYNERSSLKYDTDSKGYRFADVLRLTHPKTDSAWQNELFRFLLDERSDRSPERPESLEVLGANKALRTRSAAEILAAAQAGTLADELKAAGMTWEAVPSLVNGPWTKELWEAIIPSMGFMALLRNLRNFDQAGVSDEVAEQVAAKLTDPEQVARSRQLPMRFLSAYRAAPSLRWAYPLEKALDLSLSNIPQLKGRTLVLVDTSSSMREAFSKDGTLHRWDAAALFGLALARRCEHVDVVSYSSAQMYWSDPEGPKTKVFNGQKGESVLRALQRWEADGYFLGGGTNTPAALQQHFAGHARVVLLTDEQTGQYGYNPTAVSTSIPTTTPMYTFNLAGYRVGHAPSGTKHRHTFAGLTDQMLKTIPLLERGAKAAWPWSE